MIYYDFEYNEEHFVLEYDTEEEVQAWADNWFAEKCLQDGENSRSDEGYIITIKLDNNDEPQEISRDVYKLEYEFEPSDFEQHCTWGR